MIEHHEGLFFRGLAILPSVVGYENAERRLVLLLKG